MGRSGVVSFGAANAVDTAASFSLAGTYPLRLTAGDSQLSAQDGVTIKAQLASTGLTATKTNQSGAILLNWNASIGAVSYNVRQATVSGGPYTTIKTGVTTTDTVTKLMRGRTYYYLVSAVNAIGESPNSAPASATAK